MIFPIDKDISEHTISRQPIIVTGGTNMVISAVVSNLNNDYLEGEQEKVRKKAKRSQRRKLKRRRELFQRVVEPISEKDGDSCASIWQSVVVQAFYDLASEADNLEQRLERAEAIAWFGQGVSKQGSGEQTDFETVCELAKICPYAALKLAREIIRSGAALLNGFNFRTLRKDISTREQKKKNK